MRAAIKLTFWCSTLRVRIIVSNIKVEVFSRKNVTIFPNVSFKSIFLDRCTQHRWEHFSKFQICILKSWALICRTGSLTAGAFTFSSAVSDNLSVCGKNILW